MGKAHKRKELRFKTHAIHTQSKGAFYRGLGEMPGKGAVVLEYTPGHAELYVPAPLKVGLPPILPALFQNDMLGKPVNVIAEYVGQLLPTLVVTDQQSSAIQALTTSQSSSKYWQEWRAGRITGSVAHQVSRRSAESPSLSLIKKICYPGCYSFST